MALSAREQSILDTIASQFRTDDPAFARLMSERLGERPDEQPGGTAAGHTVPSRQLWPLALLVTCLVIFAAAMVLAGSPVSLSHGLTR